MRMFCTCRRFFLNEEDSFSEMALSFLRGRAENAGRQLADLRLAREKIEQTAWKHNQGIIISIGEEQWTMFCNSSLIPHLEVRYDMLGSSGIPQFDFKADTLCAGDFFQTDEGIIGDAFFSFTVLVVLGWLTKGGSSVLWPKAEFDLSIIRAARDGFVSMWLENEGVSKKGMLLSMVSKAKFAAMAEKWIIRLRENRKDQEWMDPFLSYLGIPELQLWD